mgnify:CR=1 FL=1
MIWNWAEVTAEQVESLMMHGAEMTGDQPVDGLPGLGPDRSWDKYVPRPDRKEAARQGSARLDQAAWSGNGEASQAEWPAPGKAWSAEVIVWSAGRPTTGGAPG